MTSEAGVLRRQLEESLGKELVLYEELLTRAEEQRRSLVSRQHESVSQSSHASDDLLARLARSQARSMKVVGELCKLYSLPEDDTSLSQLCAAMGDEAATCGRMCGRLLEVADRLWRANDTNSTLLLNEMQYVDYSLRLLAGGGQNARSYSTDASVATIEVSNSLALDLTA